MLSAVSRPHLATRRCGWRHNRYTRGASLPVLSLLGRAPRKSQPPRQIGTELSSRRSKPSSRTTLNGEQPYPWDLLQPQDVMSRHRGAKRRRRYDSWASSACYPRRTFYPLSDGPSTRDHRITMARLSSLLELSLSQVRRAYAIATHPAEFPTSLSPPSRASVTALGGDRPIKPEFCWSSSAKPMTEVNGLFNSCVTPATNSPIANAFRSAPIEPGVVLRVSTGFFELLARALQIVDHCG